MADEKKTEQSDGFLTREAIRKVPDLQARIVKVPHWPNEKGEPGKVMIRPFNMQKRRSVRKVAESPMKDPEGRWTTETDAEELEVETVIQGVVNPKDPKRPSLTYQRLAYSAEILSWGDAGIYLCTPAGMLGAAAVQATGTPDQKKRFLIKGATRPDTTTLPDCSASPSPEIGL